MMHSNKENTVKKYERLCLAAIFASATVSFAALGLAFIFDAASSVFVSDRDMPDRMVSFFTFVFGTGSLSVASYAAHLSRSVMKNKLGTQNPPKQDPPII